MRPVLCALSLFVVLVLPLQSAAAQQDQIPKELALALLPYGGADGGEIVVGQMPPDLAATFTLPPGGRVLGSFVGLSYAQVVMAFPGSADSAIAFAARALLGHGWTARQSPVRRVGGLQYGLPRNAVPTTFCKADSPDAITVAAQFHGATTTLLRLTRNTGSNGCDLRSSGSISTGFSTSMTERAVFSDMRMPDMPLSSVPPLWGPSDYRASQVCQRQGGSVSSQTQNQPLRTELSPAEILASYGRQLDSAGWKQAGGSGGSISGTWRDTVTKGFAHEVSITITKLASAPGCYDVSLRATTIDNR